MSTKISEYVDIMATEPVRARHDPVTLVRALPGRFAVLGVEDAGRRPAELLASTEERSRAKQQAARGSG